MTISNQYLSMENNSINPVQPNTTPEVSVSPKTDQTPSVANKSRVIQPVSDMSEFTNPQPVAQTATAPQPTTSPEHIKAIDTSKIYPDITSYHPNPVNDANSIQQATPTSKQRVASRVPALQVYAFLIIIFGLYIVFAYTSIFSIARGAQTNSSVSTTISRVFIMVLGLAAINVAIGIYLLISKNIKIVSSLLTALLIIGGLSLLNSTVSTVRYISSISLSTMVSLFISVGMFLYLWNVKSQVELASLDKG